MSIKEYVIKNQRIIIAVLICLAFSNIIAYAFGASSANALPQSGGEFSALFFLVLLLFPLSTLQVGIWAGCSAWIFGGFIGGAICKNNLQAFLMSLIGVIPYYFIALFIASQSVLTQTSFVDLMVLLPDFGTTLILVLLGALIGVRIERKRLEQRK